MTVPSATITVLVVDDHPVLRSGVVAMLNDQPDMTVAAEAGDGASAMAALRDHEPNVVLCDLQLPDRDGEGLIAEMLAERPDVRILALTTFGGADTIRRTLEAGAAGYLTKDTMRRELVDAVRRVASGHRVVKGEVAERLADAMTSEALTVRERDVLRELALGQSNKEIGRSLGIAEATVKIHVRHVFEKLGAHDRTQAVMKGLERGTIRLR
jgi:DNA-binding NarL/FixJ family response regulator